MIRMPPPAKTSPKALVNLLSRSRIRNLGTWSFSLMHSLRERGLWKALGALLSKLRVYSLYHRVTNCSISF
jgi:hypothetical protein